MKFIDNIKNSLNLKKHKEEKSLAKGFRSKLFILIAISVMAINHEAKATSAKAREALNNLFKDFPELATGNDFSSFSAENDTGSDDGLDSPNITDLETAIEVINNIPDTVNVEQGSIFEVLLAQQLPSNIQVNISIASPNQILVKDNNSKISYFAGRDIGQYYNYFIELIDTNTGETYDNFPPKKMFIVKGDPIVDNTWPADNKNIVPIGDKMNYGAHFEYTVDTLQSDFTYYKTWQEASGTAWNRDGYENTETPVNNKNMYGTDKVTIWNTKENGEKSDTIIVFQVNPPEHMAFNYVDPDMFEFAKDTITYDTEKNRWVKQNLETGEWEQVNDNPGSLNLGDYNNLDVKFLANGEVIKGPIFADPTNELSASDYDFTQNADLSIITYDPNNTENADTTTFFVRVIGEQPTQIPEYEENPISTLKITKFYPNPIAEELQTGSLQLTTFDFKTPIIVKIVTVANGQLLWNGKFQAGDPEYKIIDTKSGTIEIQVNLLDQNRSYVKGTTFPNGPYGIVVTQGMDGGATRLIVQ